MKPTLIIFSLIFFTAFGSFAQNNAIAPNDREAYIKVITERADKIVAVLNLENPAKIEKVRNTIRDQYSNLNDIYTQRDLNLKSIKEKYQVKAEKDSAIAKENLAVEATLAKLHKKYLNKLASHLTESQIDMVKDGMTYRVLPITYTAYQAQILTLTEDQKKQILIWLTEAREHAMDAESSEKKHAWFGKYKGKINNYLSMAGYDLKKESADWEKRRKENKQVIN